jgi:uncharacterized protein YoxC
MADVAHDSDPLSFEEVKDLHTKMVQAETCRLASSNGPSAGRQGAATTQRPVMPSTDIDRMLDALGDENYDYTWTPTYNRSPVGLAANHARTTRPTHPASHASSPHVDIDATDEADIGCVDGTFDIEDRLKEVQETLSGIEITVSTIDDTTVDVKDRVAQIERDMDTIREKVDTMQEDIAIIKEQSLAVHAMREEVRALHKEFRVQVKHHGTLMNLLLQPGALGKALGIQLDVAVTSADANIDEEQRER